MSELPDLSQLTGAEKDALILALWAELQALRRRVEEVEGQLNKSSRNSHKPPSSDGPKQVKRSRSLRKHSGRKPGGQPGHAFHSLAPVAAPDHRQVHSPRTCTGCGAELSAAAVVACDRRQVVDLPPLRLEATEHVSECKGCPVCGELSWGAYPDGVGAPVQYGPRVQALAVYLRDYQLVPYERQAELFEDLFDHRLSVATLQQAERRCERCLEPVTEAIGRAVSAAEVGHFDETSVRVGGARQWLHVASTAELTHYEVHPQRGQAALEANGILPAFSGCAVHDGYSSYWGYNDCQHGLCNAHHLRELIFMHEQHGQGWAQAMIECLLAIKQAVDEAKARGESGLAPGALEGFVRRYEAILAQGLEEIPPLPAAVAPKRTGRPKQHPAKNLLDRLSKHQAAVLAFMYDFRVPFDNNQAERDLRMNKVQQKISGGFRTPAGARRFARIRGFISTVRKQGLNVLEALGQVFEGRPWKPPEVHPA